MIGYPVFEILFFAYLGALRAVSVGRVLPDRQRVRGIAVTGMFGMSAAIAGERRSQTLSSLLASPASRMALFLGRALPSIVTGFAVAAIAFTICALILDVQFTGSELWRARRSRGRRLVRLHRRSGCASARSACAGANVTLFADVIAGSMLIVSGANVPLDQLPAGCRR